jgi:hypothetical protein
VCITCHADGALPLSEGHPPKYRCMFCHKPASPGRSSKETGNP